MKQIDRLRHEAEEAAEFRGHKLNRWGYNYDHTAGYVTCKVCGALVVIETKPMPNSIEIHGNAVALHCPV
jgi:hypothetical protein